jgi:GWxTD domain-containing protein
MRKLHCNIILIILLLTACAQPYELGRNNLASLYDPEPGFNPPACAVLHTSDSITELYLKFPLREFLYSTKIKGQSPCARVRITYFLYENYESKLILDSATYIMNDSLNYKMDRSIVRTLEIMIKPGEYLIKLFITDLNRNQQITEFIPVFKESSINQQNFILKNADNELVFNNILKKDQLIKIYSSRKENGELHVRYYHREFPIAMPPFATDFTSPFDYKADSLFTLKINAHETALINLPATGFYHFQSDSTQHEGFTLFRFSEDFPALTSAGEILQPLRYITTSKEYEVLSSYKNSKLAVDSFWLDNCANINRARGQIAKYYNRVQDANRLFTSYIEGWKTDRGIIYVVFGPPTNVYRGINTENWVYGEAGHSQSIRFSFVKVNNPFTINDFSLYRNPLYKEPWYNSVEAWRH